MCARTDRAPLTIGRTASWVSRESSTISAGFAPVKGGSATRSATAASPDGVLAGSRKADTLRGPHVFFLPRTKGVS